MPPFELPQIREAMELVKLTLKLKVDASCYMQWAQSVKGITSWCAHRIPGNLRTGEEETEGKIIAAVANFISQLYQ